MKKLNFLMVSDFLYNPDSGAAGSISTIGEQLSQLGNRVDYIWSREERKIKSPNWYRFLELPWVQYEQIKNALAQTSYDVVVISQPHAWVAVKRLKSVYPNTLFLNRTHGWEMRIEPLVYHLESHGFMAALKYHTALLFQKYGSSLTVKYSDAVICASSSDADFIKASYPDEKDKVFCISYGLDDTFLGLNLVKPKNEKVRFLFAGQYLLRKGIKDLSECFRKLQDRLAEFELTFIIHKDSKASVENDFAAVKDALNVITWMPREDLIAAYINHDAFLMPSYGEGFGKTTLEGMACGLCIIGYQEGAVADFCKDTSNALVVERGDVQALEDKILFALDHPAELKKLGQQAYLDVNTQTWRKNAEQTLDMVDSLRQTQLLQTTS